jgi:hypothetical protein
MGVVNRAKEPIHGVVNNRAKEPIHGVVNNRAKEPIHWGGFWRVHDASSMAADIDELYFNLSYPLSKTLCHSKNLGACCPLLLSEGRVPQRASSPPNPAVSSGHH